MSEFNDEHEESPLVSGGRRKERRDSHRALPFVSDQDALMYLNWASTLLFGGVVFGWASIQMLLEDSLVLNKQCDDPTGEPCVAQLDQYSLIFTVIITEHTVFGAIAGFLVDSYGPGVVAFIGGMFLTAGGFTVGLCDPNSFTGLMTGFSLHSIGSSMLYMTAWSGNFAVREEMLGTYLTVNSAFFDSSALVPWLMYGAAEVFNTSYSVVYVTYGIISFAVVSTSCFYWYRMAGMIAERQAAAMAAALSATQGRAAQVSTDLVGEKADYTAMHSLSMRQMLGTRQFVYLALLLGIHIVRMNFYTGGLRDMILEMTDDTDEQDFYTTMYSLLFPMGFLFIVPVVYVIEHYDFVTAFDWVTIGSATWGGAICIESLPLQLPAFLAFAATRALFYSTMGVAIAHTFGPLHGSTMFGMGGLLAAGLNLLVYPISVAANSTGWNVMNMLMLTTLVPVFLLRFPLKAALGEYLGGQHVPRKTSSKDIM